MSDLTMKPAVEVWPVIHYDHDELARKNAEIAFRLGCPGIFLISMNGNDAALDPIGQEIMRRHPDRKIGVNYLTKSPANALKRSLEVGFHATWCDAPGVHSERVSPGAYELSALLDHARTHMMFGSVAFKYQVIDNDPPKAALLARQLGMIPTTSGLRTGQAPTVAKLSSMRQALNGGALAVASGLSPDNIFDLGPHLSHALVSTHISKSFHEFDEKKLQVFIERCPVA